MINSGYKAQGAKAEEELLVEDVSDEDEDDLIAGVPRAVVENAGLQFIGNNTFVSPAGLVYGPDNKFRNRVNHVLAHLTPDLTKRDHTLFNVPKENLLLLIDEAWSRRSISKSQGYKEVFDISMNKSIGIAAERRIRIVVDKGTSNIITAFPIP